MTILCAKWQQKIYAYCIQIKTKINQSCNVQPKISPAFQVDKTKKITTGVLGKYSSNTQT